GVNEVPPWSLSTSSRSLTPPFSISRPSFSMPPGDCAIFVFSSVSFCVLRLSLSCSGTLWVSGGPSLMRPRSASDMTWSKPLPPFAASAASPAAGFTAGAIASGRTMSIPTPFPCLTPPLEEAVLELLEQLARERGRGGLAVLLDDAFQQRRGLVPALL